MFRLPIVKFFSRILNRITITVVLVALQVAWVLWAFFSLTTGRVCKFILVNVLQGSEQANVPLSTPLT